MGAIGKLGPNESLIGQQGSRTALSTPALVLDLDRLERNIAYLANYLGKAGHGVRPVAKIHKSVEVAKRQIEAGALGQCCATLAEAEIMADAICSPSRADPIDRHPAAQARAEPPARRVPDRDLTARAP